ncbi:transglutaminaseTgpA domain-containing protein [Streptomyces sp. S1A]|uniref:transglutaminase family protein n=1 Tax=Streptomyces sp. ICN903 TaxID=2964654 RepID=UPI001EDAF6CE|nr:transglutaminaseTgpA domain-containing protein [Streptomyces sp. ICN903]MCG3043466.1 transglutaminaseTgpA domain-containing protein [Streptomyces sp. ICN903]
MSGQARLAFCAWAATLAAACALLPLVAPAGWLFQAALLLGVQSAVGTVVRRATPSGVPAVATQAVVSLLLLTFVFVRGDAVLGVLPGPDAVEAFGALLAQGTADVGRFSIPAPVTDGIRLLLVGGVVVIGLLVDMLAVTYRAAAPAGLPLLALYSVAAGLSPEGGSLLWFLCAAGGYLLLLLAEGRDRLSRWGRVFGGGFGTARPGGTAPPPVRTGRRIGAVALGIALVVPAVLPSLGGGLLDTARQGRGTGSGGGTISAVNPLVALQDSLNQPDNRTVLTYTTDAESTSDMYLRIVALDRFDGTSWKPSERRITDLPRPLPPVPGLSPSVGTERVTTSFRAAGWYAQNWLPMPYPAAEVRIDGRWRFEPEGRTLVGDRGQTTRGVRYEVDSLVVRPTARQLAQAPAPSPQIMEEYTGVPESLPSVVAETARNVTEGAAGDYERAVRLQDWFSSQGGFRYDTQVKAGSGSAAIARFLEDREGFCVHFAFSMAAMARTLDIPARVAVGFTAGAADGSGGMTVGLQDAHAWPELYFEGVGWTRFEPTPSRGSVPEYTQPDLPSPEQSDAPAPRPEDSARPLPEPSESEECVPGQGTEDCGAAAVPRDGGAAGGLPVGRVLLVAASVLLAAGVLALPALWRGRLRSRRLEGGGDPGARTLAAWREATDSAWDLGILPQESATVRTAAARVVRLGRLEGEAAEALHRLATAAERALYAPEPRSAQGLAGDVRRVRAGLRAAAGRGARLRALLLPRSAVRVVWAVSERWSAAAGRWSGPARRALARIRPSRQRV